jgi:hypothetical protein
MKFMVGRSGKRAAEDADTADIEKFAVSIGHGRKLPLEEFLTSPFFWIQFAERSSRGRSRGWRRPPISARPRAPPRQVRTR